MVFLVSTFRACQLEVDCTHTFLDIVKYGGLLTCNLHDCCVAKLHFNQKGVCGVNASNTTKHVQ